MQLKEMKIQGVQINYYYVCKRKLWLYSKGIRMEDNSDRVLSGKLLHEKSYPRKKKRELLVDGLFKIDIIDSDYIREVKISSKMSKADRMQLLYYLYYLMEEKGIKKKGLVNYVKEKKKEEIVLTNEDKKELEHTIDHIRKIIEFNKPPEIKKLLYCTKCAYYEFCFVREE